MVKNPMAKRLMVVNAIRRGVDKLVDAADSGSKAIPKYKDRPDYRPPTFSAPK